MGFSQQNQVAPEAIGYDAFVFARKDLPIALARSWVWEAGMEQEWIGMQL